MNATVLEDGIHIYCLDKPRTVAFSLHCQKKNNLIENEPDFCDCEGNCLIKQTYHHKNPWGKGTPFRVNLGQFLFLGEEETIE